MKITGIDIGEYRQFKNIKFDFTYPEGHPKAGKPLEKVCFIGQSGTGKTTLLNVIWGFVNLIAHNYSTEKQNAGRSFKFMNSFSSQRKDKHLTIFGTINNSPLSNSDADKQNIFKADYDILETPSSFKLTPSICDQIVETDKYCLYLKDSISREADAFLADQEGMPKRLVTTTGQAADDKASYLKWINEAGFQKNIALGDMDTVPLWLFLLNEIIEYDEATPSFLIKLGRNGNEKPGDTVNELQAWLAKNPRHVLAKDCLNPILEKFFLELSLAGESKSPISLKTKAGVQIPNSTLSTGTRQLLATAIPIYKFDTNGTVILFDEPERSLFPDIQRELVKYYTGLAPEAQFFFATHSPIIAAAFEPEERFILYFDENGEVKYHKGKAPIGDDPNDVLSADFGLNELMLDEGIAAYREYLDLVTEIKNEPDKQNRMKLIAKRAALGNKYNFTTTTPDETN
jgi:ABC-type lipoprotein export system ATPase subunit